MPTAWRLISYSIYDPAMNMALDEAILEELLANRAPPTLRLYGFAPPAVSVGYGQLLREQIIDRINAAGLAVVRRPTGGRAVLHHGDLTYAFIGSNIGTNVAAAYRQICQGLIAAFASLGIESILGAGDGDYRNKNDCFAAVTGADLLSGGKKLVGSAQLRRKNAVLQHGSIILEQDQNQMGRLFGTETAFERHANLYELAGRKLTFAELEKAMKTGFESAFQCGFSVGELTEKEIERAKQEQARFLVSHAVRAKTAAT